MRWNQLSIVVLAVTIVLLAVVGQCEDVAEKSFSTSVAGMEKLLFTEQIMIDTIERYAAELQAKVNSLKNMINELRVENQKAIASPEEYLYNPLNGYSLIRRMHHDWPHIELYMAKPVGQSYLEVLQKYRPEMPTTNDLYEASEAIYRIQTTYNLLPQNISEGLLNGRQYNVKLKSIDRYFMGRHLVGKEEHFRAGYWIYSAILSFTPSDYYRIVDYGEEKAQALYAEVLLQQDRHKDALISIQKANTIRPEDAAILKRKNEIEHLAKVINKPAKTPPFSRASLYEQGCRGEFIDQPSKLYCIYNTTTSAFLRLAPLKMEILHLEPYLVIFHDIISDREIEDLQELAKPNLKRATVYSDTSKKSQVVERRTSKFSWFADNTSNTTRRINQRIRDMTGFDILGSEALQVMNYGLGGHYDTHYDFFNVTDDTPVVREQGDRISTVLFYLTDVEQGGATVFPNIRKAVFPRKGSAVVWYNLNNKVEADYLTLHAACPVIVGSKWVCNKWIRAKAQVFRKPCYL